MQPHRNTFQRLEEKLLLSPKIIYFVVCTAFYTLYLFRAKFIKNYLGLDDDEYGDISALMALVSFAFMTLWGTFADALGRHRLVLVILCLALMGSFELFLFIKDIESNRLRFYASAAALSLYSFFSCGILPLTDYLTLRLLSNRPGFSRDMYSRQRLWGTISYGVTSAIVAWSIKKQGIDALFYLLPISSASCAIVLFALAPQDQPKSIREALKFKKEKQPPPIETKPSPDNANNTSNISEKTIDLGVEEGKGEDRIEELKKPRPIVQLLTNPNYMFMLFVVFMTGSARAVMTTFLSKYWLEVMNLNDIQVGYAANFGILLEIVIFFFGPIFIRAFGIYWMLIFAQVAMVIRCWAYVILPAEPSSYWIVYFIELLKGVAFGLTQISGVKLASDAAPRGLEATAQALYTSVYSQLPAVLMAFAGGRVYKLYSPNLLFYMTSIVSTAALGLFIIKYLADGSIRLVCFSNRKRQSNFNTIPKMTAP